MEILWKGKLWLSDRFSKFQFYTDMARNPEIRKKQEEWHLWLYENIVELPYYRKTPI